MFQNDQVCLHIIYPTHGKTVIDSIMAGHQPQIWVSDLFSAQAAHPALDWQVCLAYQLRDCQYAIDAGDDLFIATNAASETELCNSRFFDPLANKRFTVGWLVD